MKAILVIDIEENGEYYADIYRKDEDDRFEGRYYPKPMPEKKERLPKGDRKMKEMLIDYLGGLFSRIVLMLPAFLCGYSLGKKRKC